MYTYEAQKPLAKNYNCMHKPYNKPGNTIQRMPYEDLTETELYIINAKFKEFKTVFQNEAGFAVSMKYTHHNLLFLNTIINIIINTVLKLRSEKERCFNSEQEIGDCIFTILRYCQNIQDSSELNRIIETVMAKHQIVKEFHDLMYIRKTKDPQPEIEKVISPRQELYAGREDFRSEVEQHYWHASVAVAEGLPVDSYDSFKATGLIISSGAELKKWGKHDLAALTGGSPKNTNMDALRPIGSNGKTLSTKQDVAAKLAEMCDRVTGKKPDESTHGKPRTGTTTIHADGFEYDAEKTPYAGSPAISPNEAQIHYKPQDIKGVLVENYEDLSEPEPVIKAIKDALILKKELEKRKIFVPFVKYNKGTMQFFYNEQELRQVLPPDISKALDN